MTRYRVLTSKETHIICNCPHCLINYDLSMGCCDNGKPRYWVSCKCGVSGPQMFTRYSAVEEWNSIMGG